MAKNHSARVGTQTGGRTKMVGTVLETHMLGDKGYMLFLNFSYFTLRNFGTIDILRDYYSSEFTTVAL